MSMITHQVEELRNIADAMKYVKSNRISKVLRDAAETISVLSAKVAAQNMEKSIAYYSGGWIPVSERLPEVKYCFSDVCEINYDCFESDFCLITWRGGYSGDISMSVAKYTEWRYADGIIDKEWVSEAINDLDDGGRIQMEEVSESDSKCVAMAWLPLPEPYKEEPCSE